MCICGIYRITNPVNGLFYVGKSRDIGERWKQHEYDFRRGKHTGSAFQFDYNYVLGDRGFIYEVLEECDEKVLTQRENNYIAHLHPQYNKEASYSCREFHIRCMRIGRALYNQVSLCGFDENCINAYILGCDIDCDMDELRYATRFCDEFVKMFCPNAKLDWMMRLDEKNRLLFVFDFMTMRNRDKVVKLWYKSESVLEVAI